MQFHKQLFRHNPPETFGDCHRTAIACLLDLKPEEVPHLAEDYIRMEEEGKALPSFDAYVNQWLKTQGYVFCYMYFTCELAELQRFMKDLNPGILYLLSGMSKNNNGHTVIGFEDKILHDPAQDNSSIVAPFDDNGCYEISLLIPRRCLSTPKGERV